MTITLLIPCPNFSVKYELVTELCSSQDAWCTLVFDPGQVIWSVSNLDVSVTSIPYLLVP